MQEYDDKTPYERICYTMDFSSLLTGAVTISSSTATITLRSGTDASPSTMLDGSPIISSDNKSVAQWIKGGVNGASYLLAFKTINSDTSKFEGQGIVTIRTVLP